MEMEFIDRAAHWQNVYQTKADRETSWFQEEPEPSLDLIRKYARRGERVIDVGGGQSNLAGILVTERYEVTVIDIAPAAIERAQQRIGDLAARVHWVVGDIASSSSKAQGLPSLGQESQGFVLDKGAPFDLWHDRAVFHFLTDADDRRRYIERATQAVKTGGHLVIGTFALDGPEKCSGLPVQRHGEASLRSAFAPAFQMIESFQRPHLTPWGKPQSFFFAVMRRA